MKNMGEGLYWKELLEDILDIPRDDADAAPEQLRYLRLCEPKRFTLHMYVDFCLTVGRLIDDDFLSVRGKRILG
ncbi:hypothetical protein NVS47_09305 [Dehalobacterium formicoaceticum]|uniref:Uncharacterized protein n=1 Tax=Dehalobacterium formicoaceticum TaxID=51515 RepID=A0ABT1Y496_9FIRM|nr:hypothetical protein [Dehalobacterium formicoaceticum]MCR6545702.1 hypothetical protein [Dehalobacterium formicoaceticum]